MTRMFSVSCLLSVSLATGNFGGLDCFATKPACLRAAAPAQCAVVWGYRSTRRVSVAGLTIPDAAVGGADQLV